MRIGIEGQRLFRKKKHGMDMVALELIRNLILIDKENEYFVFVKPDEDRCLKSVDNFTIIELAGGSYPQWEQISLPKAVKQYKLDILHCTSNTAPLKCDAKLILTLHDIIYMEKLNLFKKGATNYQRFGNLYRRWIVPRILNRSEKVITVSEFERKRIRDFFGLSDQKLVSIYNGVGTHFIPIREVDKLTEVRQKYALPDDYFFFLGNTDPKKNTPGVIQAYGQYLEKSKSDVKLVMLDYEEESLKALLSGLGMSWLRDFIHLTGYVHNQDLPGIYSQCRIFLYPSLRESFGIPVLEAMACGVPVITSNTSSMPEVSGGAAILVNPHNPQELTREMIRLDHPSDLREELIGKGLQRAADFTWETMARHVLACYREVFAKDFKTDCIES